jgi:SAM-dependent methyltransferase
MASAATIDDPTVWVRETRVGTWFLGTRMWRHHVLPGTMADLQTLLGAPVGLGRVLDVGCGQGFAFPFIDRHFHPDRLLGIDIDPDLVERGKALAASCACKADIRVGNATRTDLPDASIDTIFCHQTFHHLADQDAAAREFYRVLAPGGRLLFTESCRSFIFCWWVRLFFRHPMDAQKSAEEYLTLLRDSGFVFGADDVLTPYPPWARPDFGILETMGRPVREPPTPPLVCVVARKPA